ncbi:MAG: hypothetical protein IME96_03485 [Proteobacteria bacterium]|nr:hypothetical protein [Pseudomonadota bacterium]
MKKIKLIFPLAILALIIVASTAHAAPSPGGPHLWLSTDATQFIEGGVGYVGASCDPWLTDSYVTSDNSFTLYIYNAAKLTAVDIHLMIAVHEGERGSVTVGSATYTSFPGTDLGTSG